VNLAEGLERAARAAPDRTALVVGDRSWRYGELDRLAGAVAGGLAGLGLRAGERVALHLPNGPEFVVAYYACQKAGLVALSLNVASAPEELRFILADAAAAAVITADAVAARLPARAELPALRHLVRAGAAGAGEVDFRALQAGPPLAARPGPPDETAAILYTSATTGRPKGVMLTRANVASNVAETVRQLGMTAADVGLCALPLFHCFGQNFIMNALVAAGARLVLQERFVPEAFLDALAAQRVSLCYGVPTMYILLLARGLDGRDLSALRLCFSAAASLPGEVEREWQARTGHVIHQGYGLTETSPFASYNHAVAHRPGSIGTPIPGVEMRIVDPATGRDLPDGELGEIWIRGPNVMKGYFGDPAATAAAIQDGWFRSGDIGRRDADGYFYVVDRVKDMINVAGFKVFPREVEEVLFQHPSVREAAVVGLPDPVRGEVVRAVVVLADGQAPDPGALEALCRERLASYKVPVRFDFVPALPKNPTGKILKKELRG
jgi:long-chain acyl-CoA synthetase